MPKQLLLSGETPIMLASAVQLSSGEFCLPQHYLQFNHDYHSVSAIIADVNYTDDHYLIFVSEDNLGLFIQIGIVGIDNYSAEEIPEKKIVYGRKWRVESQLPSSEIIQTAFLALQKAREHELRELFYVQKGAHKCTPFNNHHDLPLMAEHPHLLEGLQITESIDEEFHLKAILKTIRYEKITFSLQKLEQLRPGLWFVELNCNDAEDSDLPEFSSQCTNFLLHSMNESQIYYQLMDALLLASNRHIEENFSYKNFHRFSRKHSVLAIAGLSVDLRKKQHNKEFLAEFEKVHYNTDSDRVPALGNDPASNKNRVIMQRHHIDCSDQ